MLLYHATATIFEAHVAVRFQLLFPFRLSQYKKCLAINSRKGGISWENPYMGTPIWLCLVKKDTFTARWNTHSRLGGMWIYNPLHLSLRIQ